MSSDAKRICRQQADQKTAEDPRWVRASAACRALLEKNPDHVAALHFMGGAAYHAGRLTEAREWLEKALTHAPDSPPLLINLATILVKQKDYDRGITALRRAQVLNPDDVDVLFLLGSALKDQGFETRRKALSLEAVAILKQALVLDPSHARAANNGGVACLDAGEIDAARGFFERAAKLAPDDPMPLNNLAIVLRLLGKPTRSVACCRRALDLCPAYPEALNNLGNALKDLGDWKAAGLAYEQAVALKPDHPGFQCNLALIQMGLGDLRKGFETYEWRKKTHELAHAQPHLAQPLWRGEEALGKTLLIYGEQGHGDTLQFCRYATLAARRGLRVVLCVSPPLRRLMESLEGVAESVLEGDPLPPFDYQIPTMSLPVAFQTELSSVPSFPSYLAAPKDEVSRWRARISQEQITGKKVGLVWAGNPRRQSADLVFTDMNRSMDPACLAPLMDVPGVRFFSLQKTLPQAPDSFGLIDWMQDCDDFAATAGLVTNLDLVITVDTAMAHLAGALGKPVWILNRFNGCWRWLLDREDSPWYPSARLFRQKKAGNWTDVVARVREALVSF